MSRHRRRHVHESIAVTLHTHTRQVQIIQRVLLPLQTKCWQQSQITPGAEIPASAALRPHESPDY